MVNELNESHTQIISAGQVKRRVMSTLGLKVKLLLVRSVMKHDLGMRYKKIQTMPMT